MCTNTYIKLYHHKLIIKNEVIEFDSDRKTCSQSNNNVSSHLGVYTKIVKTGATTKTVIDYKLSRYTCCLIVQNANPKLNNVVLGQTYFAIQKRKRTRR